MIRRNTWILLLLLAALVGVSFYLKGLKARQAAEATPTVGSSSLFSPADGLPTDIKIESAIGTSVEVARDQTGSWVLKAPTAAPADQASAEAAATQVGALRVLSNVELGPEIVGLDKPGYAVTIVFGSETTRKLSVGSVTPIQDGYYCRLDGGPIIVVDKFGLDALIDLLKNPPYLATLTPAVSPTPSLEPATPTPELTLQPTSSATTPVATPTR